MARPKRYHFPGSFFHVMVRGNHGQDIFFSDIDRYNMSFLLQEGVEKYGHRIHAFCFMNNHVHLLIQVGEISLSKIMQNLSFRFSQKINRRCNRLGRLFQGRFKSILIEEEVYFFRLLRYIHRNPVRANITDKPENYSWSSHNTYLGKNSISWVTKDYALSKFSKNENEAILFFSSYCATEETNDELKELRNNFKDGQVLGNDDFLENIRVNNAVKIDQILTIDEIIEAVCQVLDIQKELVISPGKSQKASYARGMISMIAVEKSKMSITHIASNLNRDSSRISRLILEVSARYKEEEKVQLEINRAKELAFQIAGSHA